MNDSARSGGALEAAKALAAVGFAVLPVRPGTKLPAVPVEAASRDVEVLNTLFGMNEGASVGIAVGPTHRLVVLDLDLSKGGRASLRALERRLGPLPSTVRTLTRDGEHHYYRWVGPYYRLELLPGLAVVGPPVPLAGHPETAWGLEAGWVVAPPSPHPAGGRYAWAPGASPFERSLAELPERWVRVIAQTAPGSASAHWLTDIRSTQQRILSRLVRWMPRRVRQAARISLLRILAATDRRR